MLKKLVFLDLKFSQCNDTKISSLAIHLCSLYLYFLFLSNLWFFHQWDILQMKFMILHWVTWPYLNSTHQSLPNISKRNVHFFLIMTIHLFAILCEPGSNIFSLPQFREKKIMTLHWKHFSMKPVCDCEFFIISLQGQWIIIFDF